MKTKTLLACALVATALPTVATAAGYVLRSPVMPSATAASAPACPLSAEACDRLSAYVAQTAQARAGTGLPSAPAHIALEVSQLRAMARAAALTALGSAGTTTYTFGPGNVNFPLVAYRAGLSATPVFAGSTAWTVVLHTNAAASDQIWLHESNPDDRLVYPLSQVVEGVFDANGEWLPYYPAATRKRGYSATVAVAGVPATKCMALASARLPDIGCTGGVATASETIADAVESWTPFIASTVPPQLVYPLN